MVKYRGPKTTVDSIILEQNQSIVLIKRKNPPYQDYWALPGGFVELGEKVEDAVIRETKEETGLTIEILKLAGVYSDPKRDPRGHTISIAYLCKRQDHLDNLKGGDDAKDAKVYKRDEIEKLQIAFDHKIIIHDALKIADQDKLW
ncbi:MAG: NUDIX hydrolase [Candidatus Helarchaeota archaeon]|nr:NUDIX hydrolase [Candidatus Helarchaeota archaeon]